MRGYEGAGWGRENKEMGGERLYQTSLALRKRPPLARRRQANAAAAPQAGSLWGGWLAALDAAMAKRLAKAVPVERYAAALGDVILRPRLPRQWCASI